MFVASLFSCLHTHTSFSSSQGPMVHTGARVAAMLSRRIRLSDSVFCYFLLFSCHACGFVHLTLFVFCVLTLHIIQLTLPVPVSQGPMVHAGACVAAMLSRLRIGPMPRLMLGVPSKQRVWVGMGAAASVSRP